MLVRARARVPANLQDEDFFRLDDFMLTPRTPALPPPFWLEPRGLTLSSLTNFLTSDCLIFILFNFDISTTRPPPSFSALSLSSLRNLLEVAGTLEICRTGILVLEICWREFATLEICWTGILVLEICWTGIPRIEICRRVCYLRNLLDGIDTLEICWTGILVLEICWTGILVLEILLDGNSRLRNLLDGLLP